MYDFQNTFTKLYLNNYDIFKLKCYGFVKVKSEGSPFCTVGAFVGNVSLQGVLCARCLFLVGF